MQGGVIPVLCRKCGALFAPPIRVVDSTISASIGTNCPGCGAAASIQGTYEFVGDVLTRVSDAGPDTLRAIAILLQRAKTAGKSDDAIVRELHEKFPNARDFLPRDAAQLAGYLSLILALILALKDCVKSAEARPPDQIIIQRTVEILQQNNYDIDVLLPKAISVEVQPRVPKTKTERNRMKRERRKRRGK